MPQSPVVGDAQAAMPQQASEAPTDEAPRRRTRTRKPREDAVDTAAPADALGADRLPPALGLVSARDGDASAPGTDDAADDAPKPRRRRIVRAASGEATPAE
ncbi:hypothetical protein [Sphingomonas sp.]|uniref:hypothetical protein n=1 Tax=Sphingomonas sp. TaxID=28214 RepID=UPI0035C7E9E1